jgi:Cu+-exporting ATPase
MIDPVCGMTVSDDAPITAEHEGETYRFCMDGCRQQFVANPQQFLAARSTDGQTRPAAGKSAGRCRCCGS